MNCKVCGAESRYLSRATILKKYEIAYFFCPDCGFVQTEEPFWLAEAYEKPIAASDTGLVARNAQMAMIVRNILSRLDPAEQFRILDYGAGHGMLVRLMRDLGREFYWWDAYCENVFAKGYEHREENAPYDLLTAIEVVEHLADPLPEFQRLFALAPTVLFSTELIPACRPAPERWWYYGLEHGQHISFFSGKSLQKIAERFNKRLFSFKNMHMLSDRELPALMLGCAHVLGIVQGHFFLRRMKSQWKGMSA